MVNKKSKEGAILEISCGVDIIKIDRVKKSLLNHGDSFKARIYTDKEIKYCESKKSIKEQSYAVRFAAKEATLKALGVGISGGVELKNVEILNNTYGKPDVLLHGRAREIYEEKGVGSISISLSHCEEYAIAYAVMLVNLKSLGNERR